MLNKRVQKQARRTAQGKGENRMKCRMPSTAQQLLRVAWSLGLDFI